MTKPQKIQILTFLATLLVIGLVLAFLEGMSDRRAKIFMASQKVGFDLVSSGNSPQLVSTMVAGVWRVGLDDDHDESFYIKLNTNGTWHWSIGSSEPNTPTDTQSGTWFIHERTLILRVVESKSDKIIPHMAFAFDIKRATPQSLVVTNGAFTKGETVWRRVAKPEELPKASVPAGKKAR